MECATETMRLALRDLEPELRGDQRPEFWQGLWALYVQSQLDWRISKAEREGRYLQCGQDMRRLLEWLERHRTDLGELESVQLLRRVFGEQFEEVERELAAKAKRPSRAGPVSGFILLILLRSGFRRLRRDFLRPFSSQSNCEIYARSSFRSENLRGQSRHILDRLPANISRNGG